MNRILPKAEFLVSYLVVPLFVLPCYWMVFQWWEACSSEAAGAEEQQQIQYWLPKLERYAKQVWDRDTENFSRASQKGSKKSETKWMDTVLRSGTLSDKFSAMVVRLQESPVHHIALLEALIDYVSLKVTLKLLSSIWPGKQKP